MRTQRMKENFNKLCFGFGTIFTAILQRNWSILFQIVEMKTLEETAIQLGINLLKMLLFSNRNICFISIVG